MYRGALTHFWFHVCMLYLYTASLKNFENYDFDNDSKYSNTKLLAKDNSEKLEVY